MVVCNLKGEKLDFSEKGEPHIKKYDTSSKSRKSRTAGTPA